MAHSRAYNLYLDLESKFLGLIPYESSSHCGNNTTVLESGGSGHKANLPEVALLRVVLGVSTEMAPATEA